MRKALIAMSGGVDSSVAAYLMQRAGFDCLGMTMRLYRNSDLGMACHKTCCAETDAEDAALVCFRLGMAFEELDYSALFRYRVIERFAAAYEAGLTPNPCVDCNRFMKFETLLEHALSEGCDKLATGHYARIGYCAESGRWELRKAVDGSKDQSYVLYMLTQRQLAHLALPLGAYRKDEVRQIAREQGFVTASKRESQDICFVPDGDYGAFLERWRGKAFPDGALLDGVQTLCDSKDDLVDGAYALFEGAVELDDGMNALKDGLEQLDEAAIQKLVDLIDGDFRTLSDRTEAMLDLMNDYPSYGGRSEEMSGVTAFVIRTEAVEAAEESVTDR